MELKETLAFATKNSEANSFHTETQNNALTWYFTESFRRMVAPTPFCF